MLLFNVPLLGQVCSARTSLSLSPSILLRAPRAMFSWPQLRLSKTMIQNKLLYNLIHRFCYIIGKLTNTEPAAVREKTVWLHLNGVVLVRHTEIKTAQRGLAWLLCRVAHRIMKHSFSLHVLKYHTAAYWSEQLHANLKQLKVLLH